MNHPTTNASMATDSAKERRNLILAAAAFCINSVAAAMVISMTIVAAPKLPSPLTASSLLIPALGVGFLTLTATMSLVAVIFRTARLAQRGEPI